MRESSRGVELDTKIRAIIRCCSCSAEGNALSDSQEQQNVGKNGAG